ncbi:hypothetical protein AeMF1_016041 [Aphanomyces euteiches]|nr:hypothetical protein AeMF1_016041 [Aphanomyces euteiches]KAH9195809.1 hypothetical protein AeNC1_002231 [Aphanomyces euteiches]
MNEIEEIARLWIRAGFPESALSRLSIVGEKRYYPSSFRVSSAATISIALSALAASEIYHLRTGSANPVQLHRRDACIEFHSQNFYRSRAGEPPPGVWDPISGLYETANGGHIRLHANFPHHKAGLLNLLNLPPNAERGDVAKALLTKDAFDFEDLATKSGMCAAACRSPSQWAGHPMGQHIQKTTQDMEYVPFNIQPQPNSPGGENHAPVSILLNCLTGLRVLSFTRVLAGPIAGRTLASHGADVLWITAPHLPSLPNVDPDTSRGKRTIQLDLRANDDLGTLKKLVQEADVMIDAYRPGALKAFGLDKDSLHALNPSLIFADVSAYGATGPWANKRGFDSLLQTATGFNVTEAEFFGSTTPKAMPVQALDHATGYFAAFGILAALYRRYTDSATHPHVEVTLAWTAEWLRHLGHNSDETTELSEDDIAQGTEEIAIGNNVSTFAKRAPIMEPRPSFSYYPQSLAEDEPVWLQR